MRRNLFDLSHEHKLSADMGYLIPVNTLEVLAGDSLIGSASALVRVAPLAKPVMHRCEIRLHHWYVPNRILWDGWEEMITGRVDDVVPNITLPADPNLLRLVDHMGAYPAPGRLINCFPVRAYNMIWNEFYRDQDLQEPRDEDDLSLARICWQKDYFTVARPSPQQGDPTGIPVNVGSAPISGLWRAGGAGAALGGTTATDKDGNTRPPSELAQLGAGGGVFPFVDLSEGDAQIDINDLRRSLAFQRFAEARARFGERYVDYLRYIGVNPSDGRLDRPEYLGGGKQTISFSEVLSTADSDAVGVGDMFGHGIAALKSKRYRKFFEEHGIMLTLMSIRPKTVYQDMFPRKFTRTDNMSYWQKELEVLPWQEVRESEIHHAGDPDTIFGYVPRYEEYRHEMSFVSGTLRGGTEEDWTLARTFETPPVLNGSFVECTPSDRVYQDTNMPECIVSVTNRVLAKRPVRSAATIGEI